MQQPFQLSGKTKYISRSSFVSLLLRFWRSRNFIRSHSVLLYGKILIVMGCDGHAVGRTVVSVLNESSYKSNG